MAVEEIAQQITLSNLHDRLRRVENTQLEVVSRLGTLETRMGNLESSVASLETRMGSLEKQVVAIETLLDGFAGRLEQLEKNQALMVENQRMMVDLLRNIQKQTQPPSAFGFPTE